MSQQSNSQYCSSFYPQLSRKYIYINKIKENLNLKFESFHQKRHEPMSLNKSASKSRKPSQGPPPSTAAQQTELTRLRQQLISKQKQIKDLQEELLDQNQQYLAAIKERDAGTEKLKNAKESMSRFDALVKQQVDRAMAGERKEKELIERKLKDKEVDLEMLQQAKDHQDQKVRELQEQLDDYRRLQQPGQAGQDPNQTFSKVKQQENQLMKKDKEMDKLRKHVNYLQDQIEDFMAENKQLRDLSAVPDNFGIDREKVRLMDREKIDDYKKLVRILQEDNYELEKERAQLKHKLKQASMMNQNTNTQGRYDQFQLSADQWSQVDKYVMNLINGEVIDAPEIYDIRMQNEILKAQIEVYKDKDVDKVRSQMELVLKQLTGDGPDGEKSLFGGGISQDQLNQILGGYEDIKKQLAVIAEQGVAMGKMDDPNSTSFKMNQTANLSNAQMSQLMIPGHLRYPEPAVNADGTIHSGYSFRYGTHLPVTGRQGEKEGVDKQDIDNAFLQLQLLECFEKIDKQDEIMRTQKREVDQLYGRIQRYILMQDHLYKDYAKLEKKNEELSKSAAAKAMDAEEQLQSEKQKVKDLENLVQQLQRQPGTDANSKQIIDLQKQNTILEVNMIQQIRKYQNLDEKEKLLRRNYEVVHAQMSEMQVECQERICELKAWKSNAIFQMKGAYEQLKTAYPEAEYQRLEGELKLINNKYADQINTISELRTELQEFKINQRKINEQADEQIEMIQYKEDLEKQYNYLSSRLKNVDQRYRYEQHLLKRMVARLKKSNVSIDKAFDNFDKDKDGYITPQEMADAILAMGFDDMSSKDLEILIKSMDTDENGLIEYKEFSFLLQRCGLKTRSIEETMVYNIIRTIQKMKRQKSHLFELIDKDSNGYITKVDFKEFLDQLKSEHITDTDIENFLNYFFKHESGGDLNLNAFVNKFTMYEKMMKDDEQGEDRDRMKDARPIVSEETLRQKKQFFDELKGALDSIEGATLRIIFNKIDSDKSGDLNFKKFKELFAQMKIPFKHEALLDIFKSMDVDGSGSIEWAELLSDYNKVTSTSFIQLWEEEKVNRAAQHEMEDDEMEGFGISYSQRGGGGFGGGGMSDIMKADLERKINSLESKLKLSQKEIKKEQELKEINNKTLVFLQKSYDEIKMQFQHAKEEIFNHEVKLKIMTDDLRKSISKEDSEKIQQENVTLKTELRETKSAMLSYKNLHNVVCEQVKSLKLLIERRKDENESLQQSVREMAAESLDNSKMDKLRYVVMLSRWQEAAVNKKYDMKINECNVLKTQIIEKDEEIRSMEVQREHNQNDSGRLVQENQSLRKQLARAKILFLPLNKAEKFEDDIKKISHERDQIEINYFKLRSEYTTVKNMRDNLQIMVDTYKEWKSKLENAKQPQLTSEITKMIDKIQDMRIKTLKAESKTSEMTERNQHLEKLLDIKKKEASSLEEKFAKIERDLEVQKQQWRERDNERIKKFFAAKLKEEDQQRDIERKRAARVGHIVPQPMQDILNDDSRPKSAAETMKDQQIERLEEACAKLKDKVNELEEQNALINKFSEQNLKILGDPQKQMDQKIEQYAYQFQQVSQSEKEEILEAAQETIKTLNEMLDHKKKQLGIKERQIEKLRDELLQQRQAHADKVRSLHNEVYDKGSSTLARLHDYVDKHATGADRPGLLDEADNFKRQVKAGEIEMQKANTRLDELRELNLQIQSDLDHERARAVSEKSAYEGEIEDLKAEIGKLKSQIQLEKRKREELAKQRLQKNDNMYRKFEEKMLEQEKQIMKLKDQNEVWKMREKANKQMSGAKDIDLTTGVSGKERDEVIAKLQEEIKKRDQQLVDQRKKLDKSKSSKETLQGEKDKVSKDLTKYQENNNRLAQDKSRSEEVINKLNNELKHLKNEVQELRIENKRHLAEKQGVGKGQMSFKDLEEKLQDANDQNFILRQQKETVVAVNPKSQAFEYIGNPLHLRQDGADEIETIDQLLKEITKWNQRPGNELISVGQIFQSVDMHSYEELSPEQFNDAMIKCGIRLRDYEMRLLKTHLVKDELGQMKYMTMVRALSGIPQQDFMNKGINKLASVVEGRNLTKAEFKQLIDPNRLSTMTLEQLQEAFKKAKHNDFRFDETEVRGIFLYITGTKNPAGVQIDADNLTQAVFESVKGLLLEQIRLSLLRQDANLNKMYQTYDRNRDDIMDAKEFEKALSDYGLHIPPNLALFLYNEVFDPSAARQRRSIKISKKVLRKYVECFGTMGSRMVRVRDRAQEQNVVVDDQDLINRPVGNISAEDEARSKITSRKILAKLHQNLLDLISKLDHLEDGIILRSELTQALLDSKVPDLNNEEVVNLLKLQDRGQRGYISITKFIDNIYEFATETETDQILRRVANAVAHNTNVNIRESLDLVDVQGNGLLEKQDLKRALRNCQISVSDNELDTIYKEMGNKIAARDSSDQQINSRTADVRRDSGTSSYSDLKSKMALKTEGRAKLQPMTQVMDTRKFVARIELIGKSKPLPQYIFNQKGGKSSTVKPGASAGMMTAYDNEKKYSKNLDLLRTEIEEKNREIDAKDKEIRECKTRISYQEKEKKKLETQLMNKDQKPPKQTQDESKAFDQAQELIQVKDQLYYQQEENLKLKKSMKVTLKAEITRITAEKDQLDEKLRDKNDEISKLQNTIQRLFARPMDNIEKREELELQKQFKINELEDMVSVLEKEKENLQDELFKSHETNLSLKFEKETYDLQYARLQKRIKDLDQYKEKTSKISSQLLQDEQEDYDEIDEQTGKTAASQKKKKESVKFRKKPIQSVSELEMVVESLKRVVEKLKVENEHLKKENAKYSGVGEKVNLEKSLRTKISNLETIIQSHEMKDVNLDEQKQTIKKLIDANKQLRFDLEKEVDRYTLLENKYRDVLSRFNLLDKENQRNEEMIFGMTTGTNIRRHQNYMLEDMDNE